MNGYRSSGFNFLFDVIQLEIRKLRSSDKVIFLSISVDPLFYYKYSKRYGLHISSHSFKRFVKSHQPILHISYDAHRV